MSDRTDQFTRRVCFSVYATHRAFNRYYQTMLSETGLTYPKLVILYSLSENGPLTVSDLSARAGVEPNTLSPLLKKMAEFGTITRERAPEDERKVVIRLTEMGQAILERADTTVLKSFSELNLDYEQAMQAVLFLETTREQLDKATPTKLHIDDITS